MQAAMNQESSIQSLIDLVRRFCEERDWDQFHDPKDLAIGLVTEASELLEEFRFLTDAESLERVNDPEHRTAIEDELADVLFFLLRFSQRFDIDLADALNRKMEKNAKRYTVDLARGSNRKIHQEK